MLRVRHGPRPDGRDRARHRRLGCLSRLGRGAAQPRDRSLLAEVALAVVAHAAPLRARRGAPDPGAHGGGDGGGARSPAPRLPRSSGRAGQGRSSPRLRLPLRARRDGAGADRLRHRRAARAAVGAPVVRALPDGRRRPQLRRERVPRRRRVSELDGRHRRAARGDARRHHLDGRGARLRRSRRRLPRRARPRARLLDGAQRRGAHARRRRGARSPFRASTSTTCCAAWRRWCAGPKRPARRCRWRRSALSSTSSPRAGPTAWCASSAAPADFHRTTVLPTADCSPSPRGPTSTFPLLLATSEVGAPSEALTRQWSTVRSRLQ